MQEFTFHCITLRNLSYEFDEPTHQQSTGLKVSSSFCGIPSDPEPLISKHFGDPPSGASPYSPKESGRVMGSSVR